jgi:hypothetical protein
MKETVRTPTPRSASSGPEAGVSVRGCVTAVAGSTGGQCLHASRGSRDRSSSLLISLFLLCAHRRTGLGALSQPDLPFGRRRVMRPTSTSLPSGPTKRLTIHTPRPGNTRRLHLGSIELDGVPVDNVGAEAGERGRELVLVCEWSMVKLGPADELPANGLGLWLWCCNYGFRYSFSVALYLALAAREDRLKGSRLECLSPTLYAATPRVPNVRARRAAVVRRARANAAAGRYDIMERVVMAREKWREDGDQT